MSPIAPLKIGHFYQYLAIINNGQSLRLNTHELERCPGCFNWEQDDCAGIIAQVWICVGVNDLFSADGQRFAL
jgi:hypothetical protein